MFRQSLSQKQQIQQKQCNVMNDKHVHCNKKDYFTFVELYDDDWDEENIIDIINDNAKKNMKNDNDNNNNDHYGNCDSNNVIFNPKRRKIVCNICHHKDEKYIRQCGKYTEFYDLLLIRAIRGDKRFPIDKIEKDEAIFCWMNNCDTFKLCGCHNKHVCGICGNVVCQYCTKEAQSWITCQGCNTFIPPMDEYGEWCAGCIYGFSDPDQIPLDPCENCDALLCESCFGAHSCIDAETIERLKNMTTCENCTRLNITDDDIYFKNSINQGDNVDINECVICEKCYRKQELGYSRTENNVTHLIARKQRHPDGKLMLYTHYWKSRSFMPLFHCALCCLCCTLLTTTF